MGNTVGAASKRQSTEQDGNESQPISRTFDLSSLEGWGSATNCFSLHVAGAIECTSVQVQTSTASLGSRRYKTLLSDEQLDDPNAVAQFAGEMRESGMLKVTFMEPSLGKELSLGYSSKDSAAATRKAGSPYVREDIFNCLYQEMKGVSAPILLHAGTCRRYGRSCTLGGCSYLC